MKTLVGPLLGPLLSLLVSLDAAAFTPANLRDTAPGTRSGLLGEAVVASGKDESMVWLNPAGLAFAERSSLGLGLAPLGRMEFTVDGFFRDPSLRGASAYNDDGRSSATELLPTSIGVLLELSGEPGEAGHQSLALGLFQTFANDLDLLAADHLHGRFDLSLEQQYRGIERNTAAGAGWGMLLDSHWAIGASLFAAWSASSSTQQLSTDYFDRATWGQATNTNRFFGDYQDLSLLGVLGVQWHGPGLALGASLQLPPQLLYARSTGHGEFLEEQSNKLGTRATRTIDQTALASPLREQSLVLTLGVSVELLEGLVVELDGSVFGVLGKARAIRYDRAVTTLKGDSSDTKNDTVSLEYHSITTFNVALGAELDLGGPLLLLGLFTDRATWLVPADDDVLGTNSRHFDRLGASLGIGGVLGPGSVYAGLRYTHGAGNFGALEFSPKDDSVAYGLAQAEEHRLLFLFGGSLGLEAGEP